MKITNNSVSNKKIFRILLFQGCPIWGKLTFDKEKRGYLKYFDKNGEVTNSFESYNTHITKSILEQARAICTMRYCNLWSY